MYRPLIAYGVLLLVFGTGTFAAIRYGARLYGDRAPVNQPHAAGATLRQQDPGPAPPSVPGTVHEEGGRTPFSILLLQVIAIIAVAKLVGALVRKMGQPAVIGEMIAGILLGASVLGALSPPAAAYLFPPESLEVLKLLSQLGVIVFMFVVGMGVDVQSLRRKAHTVVLVSHASIVVPMFLGAVYSILIYPTAAAGVGFGAFALFMSVAMSITAFPVLARILEERGLSETYLGNAALACAAVDDATAWCLLAAVVAIIKADGLTGAALGVVAVILFIGVMLFVLKPLAGRLFRYDDESKTPDTKSVPVAVLLLSACAFCTEAIGIHALFGAFLAGVIMPAHAGLRRLLTERLGGFTSGLLLPIFFAFTGLRTQINLLNGWSDWGICAGVIMVAVAGKLGGSMLAARWSGMGWHESLSLGVLMNTRGLMELVVLNIGYDLGILSPRIFSMMVIMALVTTFMTGPVFSLLDRWERREVAEGTQKAMA